MGYMERTTVDRNGPSGKLREENGGADSVRLVGSARVAVR